LGPVKIGHDVIGGTGLNSGSVATIGPSGAVASVSLGGSLIGGTNSNSGTLGSTGDMGAISVGHDVVGGSGTFSGVIGSKHALASVSIGGSLYAGSVLTSGAIGAGDNIGAITIKGSIVGNATAQALIGARGQATPTATEDVAIGSLTVKGNVEYALIAGGWDTPTFTPVNGNAQIGKVNVSGHWLASHLVVGAMNLGADDAPGGVGANADNVNFGDAHDVTIAGGTIGKIASNTISGRASGPPGGTDHFGLVAREIVSCKIGGVKLALQVGTANDLPPTDFAVGGTGDVRVREVA
jgi:hypothetical protein